jgi:hypothetical protein
MFSSNGQTMMTLFPQAGPDDQSGRVQTSMERLREMIWFCVIMISRARYEKSAMTRGGC